MPDHDVAFLNPVGGSSGYDDRYIHLLRDFAAIPAQQADRGASDLSSGPHPLKHIFRVTGRRETDSDIASVQDAFNLVGIDVVIAVVISQRC